MWNYKLKRGKLQQKCNNMSTTREVLVELQKKETKKRKHI